MGGGKDQGRGRGFNHKQKKVTLGGANKILSNRVEDRYPKPTQWTPINIHETRHIWQS